jgi:sphingosine kinase
MSLEQNGKITYSHLALLWGILSDIDFESEKIRWAGSARFDIYAILRACSMRFYNGQVYYLTPEHEGIERNKEAIKQDSACGNRTFIHIINSIELPELKDHVGPLPKYVSSEYESWPNFSGPFSIFSLVNLPYVSKDVLMAPKSRLSDGLMYMTWANEISSLDMLSVLANASKAGHLGKERFTTLPVKAIVLNPGGRVGKEEKRGYLSVSGERMTAEMVKVEVHAALMNILVPFWLDEDRNTSTA